jgi:hypothetical protein
MGFTKCLHSFWAEQNSQNCGLECGPEPVAMGDDQATAKAVGHERRSGGSVNCRLRERGVGQVPTPVPRLKPE